MNHPPKPGKKSIDLQPAERPAGRPSRIRREPPPAETRLQTLANRIDWGSREWEIRLAVAGIIFFAIAISAFVIDLGHLFSL